jgi:hypothetical protein
VLAIADRLKKHFGRRFRFTKHADFTDFKKLFLDYLTFPHRGVVGLKEIMNSFIISSKTIYLYVKQAYKHPGYKYYSNNGGRFLTLILSFSLFSPGLV